MKKSIFLSLLLGLAMSTTLLGQDTSIKWKSLAEAQQLADSNDKKVMLFAEATWCSYCQKMYKEVFPQETVQDSLHKYFYPVRVDIESKEKVVLNGRSFTEREIAAKFSISRTPTIVFFDSTGSVIGAQPGYLPPAVFDKLLAYVGQNLTGTISFRDYLSKHGVDIGK